MAARMPAAKKAGSMAVVHSFYRVLRAESVGWLLGLPPGRGPSTAG